MSIESKPTSDMLMRVLTIIAEQLGRDLEEISVGSRIIGDLEHRSV